uniref:Uncharacterized protein n=1 Tax=Octopus bimaculoides TaxID=37653 RepID=A0A0L8G9I2_OCTBM
MINMIPEINICWLVAVVLFNIEQNTSILRIRRLQKQNWLSQGMDLLIQTNRAKCQSNSKRNNPT